MRLLVPTLAAALAAALVLPVVSARADGETDPAMRLSRMELEVKALRADVEYLRAREASTSRYLQAMSTAVQNLSTGVARSRQEGFEAAAVSGPSRVALLRALETLATDLSTGIPVPSRQELALRAAADDLRKQVAK
jgi:hypothetical protein